MKNRNVLIIGGTGFLGSNLIRFLKKKKFKIFSVSKRKIKIRKISGVKYINFDITNYKSLKKLNTYNFNHVINLSGYVDHKKKKETYNTHYIGCKYLVNYFREKKILSFIQIGSSTEYGKNRSPQYEGYKIQPKDLLSHYSKSKLLATKYLINQFKENNFPAIILRLYLVYGPYQDYNRIIPIVFQNCIKNQAFSCSDGNQIRNFLYVEDFCTAIYNCLKKNPCGEILNIGSEKSYKVKYIINKIKRITSGGKPLFGKIKLRKDEQEKIFPSLKKSKKFLGNYEKTKIETGLKKTLRFYKNEQK